MLYDDGHWALEGSDLFYGDQFGGNVPLLGFENDSGLLEFREGRLCAVPQLGACPSGRLHALFPKPDGRVRPAGGASDRGRSHIIHQHAARGS